MEWLVAGGGAGPWNKWRGTRAFYRLTNLNLEERAMKTRWVLMSVVCGFALAAASWDAQAQVGRKKSRPDASQEASVTQVIGVNNHITITYHRPGVKGRNVWTEKSDNPRIGALVPRDGNPWPWRAGANEATVFRVEEDVKVEGQPLPKGEYGLFMIPSDNEWTIIFSKDVRVWGSFTYKAENDVLRVKVKPVEAPHKEWLEYGFEDLGPWGATAYLHWEKVKVPFRIEMTPAEQG